MDTVYKGIKVIYSEGEDKWIGTIRGERRKYGSLKAIKKAIDYAAKKEFERIPCIADAGGWSGVVLVAGEVTSLNASGEGWVVFQNGDRRKFNTWERDRIYKDTEGNRNLAKEINDLKKQIDDMTSRREKMLHNLEQVSFDDAEGAGDGSD